MREWTQRHIEELIDKHAGGGGGYAMDPLANFSHWSGLDVRMEHGSQNTGSRTLSVMLGSEKIDLQGTVDFLTISMRVNIDLIVPRGDILDAALPQPLSSLTNPITSRYDWRVLDEPGGTWTLPLDSGTVLNAAPQTVLQDYSSTFNSGVPIRTQQVDGGGISTLSINGNRRALVFRFGDNWHYTQYPSNIIVNSGGGEMDILMTCIRVNGGLSAAMGRLCPLRTT